MKKKEIVLLTPMRGIAALVVVFYHLRAYVPNLNSNYGFIFDRGYLWVDFFFILSGFIISYVYRESIITKKNYREFIFARFARIYPLHFFILSLFILETSTRFFLPTNYAPFTAPGRTVPAIFTNLLLIHSLGIHNCLTWNQPSWSISTEWTAYLLFPVLCLFTKKWKARFYLFAIFIDFIILSQISIYNGSLDLTYDYGFFRCILEFFLGMSVYYFYNNSSISKFFRNDTLISITLVLTILFISIPSLAKYDFLIILLFAILLMSLSIYEEGIYNKIIGNKLIKLLGDISYSIYLTHVFIISIIYEISKKIFSSDDFALNFNLRESLLYVFIVVLLTLIFSYFTYNYIEIPARVYLKKKMIPQKVKKVLIQESVRPK